MRPPGRRPPERIVESFIADRAKDLATLTPGHAATAQSNGPVTQLTEFLRISHQRPDSHRLAS